MKSQLPGFYLFLGFRIWKEDTKIRYKLSAISLGAVVDSKKMTAKND